MKIGTSEKIISPLNTVDLSGYGARIQPATGKYDELYAKVIFLANDETSIVWINCDLIGFDNYLAEQIRQLVAAKLNINIDNVILCATHTHSGPATVRLRECGNIDQDYIIYLKQQIIAAALEAMTSLINVDLWFSEILLDNISKDRRMRENRHTDNKMPVMAFKNKDNTYAAVLANFALHNVGLTFVNRNVSADIFGYAANFVKANLPGNPTVLITNGACGNVNPLECADDYAAVEKQGKILGEKIIEALACAASIDNDRLEVSFNKTELPLEVLSKKEVTAVIDDYHKYFLTQPSNYISNRTYQAMQDWAKDTIRLIESGEDYKSVTAFFQIINIGLITYVGINAEVFSRMADILKEKTGQKQLYVVGYANGCIGYLPPEQIYKEGGYEVNSAYKFYGNFRIQSGSFEKLQDLIVKKIKDSSKY